MPHLLYRSQLQRSKRPTAALSGTGFKAYRTRASAARALVQQESWGAGWACQRQSYPSSTCLWIYWTRPHACSWGLDPSGFRRGVSRQSQGIRGATFHALCCPERQRERSTRRPRAPARRKTKKATRCLYRSLHFLLKLAMPPAWERLGTGPFSDSIPLLVFLSLPN